jgi:hypothetical protein
MLLNLCFLHVFVLDQCKCSKDSLWTLQRIDMVSILCLVIARGFSSSFCLCMELHSIDLQNVFSELECMFLWSAEMWSSR